MGLGLHRQLRASAPSYDREGPAALQRPFPAPVYDTCMKKVPMALISHLVCLPMQFRFLCQVVKGDVWDPTPNPVLLRGAQ